MNAIQPEYDVIVVGAGPAGSCAAGGLVRAGLKVLLIEQRKSIGGNVQCAEYVPRMISSYAGLRAADIAQPVKGIKTFINGEPVSVLKAPGFILNRGVWEKQLADEAAQAGAQVITGVRAIDTDGLVVTLAAGADYREVKGKVVLGCDGPRSLISRKLGNSPQENCVAVQYEMLLKEAREYAEIYFDPAYYGGYAWAFPKGKTVNVGLAVHISHKDKMTALLDGFAQQLIAGQVVQDETVLTKTAGLIPSGGLAECLAKEQLLLAGDAAGCTHPITGAGIMSAVVSGHLAAKAVVKQAGGDAGNRLAESYSRALTAQYGAQLQQARRRLLARNQEWTDNRTKFSALIKSSWIAFPEYYR